MAQRRTEDELTFILYELGKVCEEMLHLLKKAKEEEIINELTVFREGKKRGSF